jgi:hypothetical protein
MGEQPNFYAPDFRPEESVLRERVKNTHQRLPYGAVPLMPYHEKHPDYRSEGYLKASLKNIDDILKRNYRNVINEGLLVGDTEIHHKIYHMVQASLFLAQSERVQHHHRHYLDQPLDRGEKVIAAEMGLATPDELSSILIENPTVVSIELAKQSRPFRSDPEYTHDMDDAIGKLLEKYESQLVQGDWTMRSKLKGINPHIPAAIVVTKTLLATIDLGNGEKAEIIQRQANLIRGDEVVKNLTHPPIDRLIKNAKRTPELLQLVNTTINERQTPLWLISMTKSTYEHRIRATEAA